MSQPKLATLSILLVTMVWGGEFVLIHNALDLLPPYSFNTLRFLFASLFLWLCLITRGTRRPWNRHLVWHGFALGSLLAAAFATQTIGMLYTSVSNAGFITGLNVVLVPAFAFFILKERPRALAIVGTLLAAGGLFLLTGGATSGLNRGDLLVLACAALLALHIVLTSRVVQRHEVLSLTLVQMLTVTVLSLAGALTTENWRLLIAPEVLTHPTTLLALFVASVLGTGLAFLAQTWAQGLLSATRVALILTLEPVFAALAGYLLLHERLGAAALFGALLILTGIVLAECPRRPAPESLQAEGIKGSP